MSNTEIEQEESTALVPMADLTPMQLFEPGRLDPIVERIKATVRGIRTDISSEEGRKAIRSLVRKIASSKTFIDEQRTILVGDEKRRLANIDAEGRRVRLELEALQDEVRKPLTDWETAEEQRKALNEQRIAAMRDIAEATFLSLDNIERASGVLDLAWDHNFGEFIHRAGQAHEDAALNLQRERSRIEKAEADRLEQERMRAKAAENARVAREARIAEDARLAAEAEARRREEAKAAEAKEHEAELLRVAAEERTRLERDKAEAEQRARDAEREQRYAAQKADADKIAAEKKTAADAKRAREKAEADRELAVANERKRQEAIRAGEMMRAQQAEREKQEREADETHRREVQKQAVLSMTEIPPFTSYLARQAIDAIAKGLIPGVTINY